MIRILLWAFANDGPISDHTFNRGGHDEQSNTMPLTRPNRRARRDPDGWHSHSASAQITLDRSVLLLFRAFVHFEGYWACLALVVIDTTDKARSKQLQSLAIIGKRTKERRERERERERERRRRRRRRSRSWSSVEVQGPRSRCQMLTEKVQTLCFLQFVAVFELVQAKSPQGRPARIALDFYQRKARSVFSQRPSNWIGYSGVVCDMLRTFWRLLLEVSEDLTEGLRSDRVREVLQKNSKSLPFPYFKFSFLFFSFKKFMKDKTKSAKAKSRVPPEVSISRM